MPPSYHTLLPRRIIFRRAVYFSLVILTTLMTVAIIAHSFILNDLSIVEIILLILYTLLIGWISLSFWNAAIGFLVLLSGGDSYSIGRLPPNPVDSTLNKLSKRTALVMPIFNEDPARVFAGLRSIFQSLQETARDDEFDLFLLSDTLDPETWVKEELYWYRMCCDFNAHGKIFYRNRENNIRRKSGNIEDFCKRWGKRYRYMIVLDADSLMGGPALTKLVDLMEAHPRVALIQSVLLPINNHSLFGRILQFANHVYNDIHTAGSSWWQMSSSNYCGHNAIIRVRPFAKHCGLPELPGCEPFGGNILSHDFVEAALLRRAGWEVWLGYEIGESYEELPPTLIDYAKRDRRWCQGDFQHINIIMARGFHGMSRMHMAMGIMSFLSSPLWLLFLVLSGFSVYTRSQSEKGYLLGENIFQIWPDLYLAKMTIALLVVLLFVPKILSLMLLFFRGIKVHFYGGYRKILLSVILESVFSILTAPVLMFYHTKFVVSILLGKKNIGWPRQNRDGRRVKVREAAAAHGGQMFFGVAAGITSYIFIPDFFWWFTPVLIGLFFVIPVSIMSSSTQLGALSRRFGLFITPEESNPSKLVRLLRENQVHLNEDETVKFFDGTCGCIADLGICTLHLSLLLNHPTRKRRRRPSKALVSQLYDSGFDSLSSDQKRVLISDPDTLMQLHSLFWTR